MVQNQAGSASPAILPTVITVSIDEKPGVQAIENTAPDLPPLPGKYPTIARDHEYKRHGTVSILASLDLHDGHVIARVEDRHRRREFIQLLKNLDSYYAAGVTIRIILDNHSSHISKDARIFGDTTESVYLRSYTETWFLAESGGNSIRQNGAPFLKGISVKSKSELKQRIRLGLEEINAAPVVDRWKKFDLLMTG